jgi:chromosome partitioning protein
MNYRRLTETARVLDKEPEPQPQTVEPGRRGRILAVTNQKGGVGKTTTAINTATALAMAGRLVLLVDVDPQGNLTSGVGLKGQRGSAGTIYEALTNGASADHGFVLPTRVENLYLLPADRNLTGAEIEMVTLPDRERRLQRVLQPLRARFDYIVIDCPPSLGLLTLNALVAADAVLIPLHCEYFALEGLADLVSTMRRVRSALNPSLDIEGVLLTMYDERTNLGQQVARDVRDFFKEKVFQTVIPRNVRLGEAPSHGMPAIVYDAKSRGAEAYIALAHEVLARDAVAQGAGVRGQDSGLSQGTEARGQESGLDQGAGVRGQESGLDQRSGARDKE